MLLYESDEVVAGAVVLLSAGAGVVVVVLSAGLSLFTVVAGYNGAGKEKTGEGNDQDLFSCVRFFGLDMKVKLGRIEQIVVYPYGDCGD